MDYDITSPTCAQLQLIRRAALLRVKADENLCIAQRKNKEQYDKRVRLAAIFKKGGGIFLDRPKLFRSAAKRFAAEGYCMILPAMRAA